MHLTRRCVIRDGWPSDISPELTRANFSDARQAGKNGLFFARWRAPSARQRQGCLQILQPDPCDTNFAALIGAVPVVLRSDWSHGMKR